MRKNNIVIDSCIWSKILWKNYSDKHCLSLKFEYILMRFIKNCGVNYELYFYNELFLGDELGIDKFGDGTLLQLLQLELSNCENSIKIILDTNFKKSKSDYINFLNKTWKNSKKVNKKGKIKYDPHIIYGLIKYNIDTFITMDIKMLKIITKYWNNEIITPFTNEDIKKIFYKI